MTVPEVSELLADIAEAFPERFKPSPATVRLWARLLVDLDVEEGRRALDEHLVSSPHPPTIADIRSRAAAHRVGLPDVAAAWEEVARAIQRCGRDDEPRWSHPAIASAVAALGWRELCNTLNEDMPTVRAQWRGFYGATSETITKRANVGALEARTGAVSAGDAVQRLLSGKGKVDG